MNTEPRQEHAGTGRALRAGLVLALLLAAGTPCAAWAGEASRVDLNFDRVDIRLLVRLVSEVTGRPFVVDERVEGRLTVVTSDRVDAEEVYPLFLSILESSGWTIMPRGEVQVVVPLAERAVRPAPLWQETPDDEPGGMATHILRLEHLPAADVAKALQPMVAGGPQGALTAVESSNHLLITDTIDTLRRLETIVRRIDQPGLPHLIRVVPLETAPAEAVARQLREAFAGMETAADRMVRHVRRMAEGVGRGTGEGLVILAAEYSNSLVLVGSETLLGQVAEMARLLDRPPRAGQGPLHAIFLKYLSAEVLAQDLKTLIEQHTGEDRRTRMAVEANLANNALLVYAPAHDFEWLRDVVAQLDRVPQQVLVEVLIAEVTLDRGLDFGMEWTLLDTPAEGRSSVIGRIRPGEKDVLMDWITRGTLPQGLTLALAQGVMTGPDGQPIPRMPILLQALAGDRNVNILSNVPLWAQNNTEASVSVVENRPILRSTIEAGAGTARDIIQNIDRLDIGIKLKVTPQVHPDGHVQLTLNPSIEAIVDEGPAEAPFTPTIAKREVQTTVTVPDQSTVMLSGLIRDDRVRVVSKVPLLGDIPFLGYLFRRHVQQNRRTNLLIFVTPTIVTDAGTAARVRAWWEERSSIDAQPGPPSGIH